jgi:hypothetical protein
MKQYKAHYSNLELPLIFNAYNNEMAIKIAKAHITTINKLLVIYCVEPYGEIY